MMLRETTTGRGEIQPWWRMRTPITGVTPPLTKRLSPSSPSTTTTSGSPSRSLCGSCWPCSWNLVSDARLNLLEGFPQPNLLIHPPPTAARGWVIRNWTVPVTQTVDCIFNRYFLWVSCSLCSDLVLNFVYSSGEMSPSSTENRRGTKVDAKPGSCDWDINILWLN